MIDPWLISFSREIDRRSVDFPAPFDPSRLTASPGCTWRSMPWSTSTRPYDARTPSSRRSPRAHDDCTWLDEGLAEVRLHHPLVRAHVGGEPLDDLGAGIHHGERVTEREQEVHLVADEHHRGAAPARCEQQVSESIAVGRRQSGRGLDRAAAPAARSPIANATVEQPQVPVGDLRDRRVDVAAQVATGEQVRRRDSGGRLRSRWRTPRAPSSTRTPSGCWKVRTSPLLGDHVRSGPVDPLTEQPDLTAESAAGIRTCS